MPECVVYLLRSEKDGNFYVSQTTNLVRRMAMHNSGQVIINKESPAIKTAGLQDFFKC